MRSARKISDLPSAWIKKIKGVSCWVSLIVGEGLEHLQQNCGKGSGDRKGLESSVALMGKKEVRSNDKALFGVGKLELFELGEKATGVVF